MVVAALESEEARSGRFMLAPRTQVISTWKRRGMPEEMGSYSGLSFTHSTPSVFLLGVLIPQDWPIPW